VRLRTRRASSIEGAHEASYRSAGPSRVVQEIENRISSASTDQLLARYHELIDKRLDHGLGFMESFELERIEARLDMGDELEESRITQLDDRRQECRQMILDSIEHLIARLRATA
jgi:hypothetical protein